VRHLLLVTNMDGSCQGLIGLSPQKRNDFNLQKHARENIKTSDVKM